jgi:hypothetical protein
MASECLEELIIVVPALGLQLISVPMRTSGDFEAAFAAMMQRRPNAFVTTSDPLIQRHMGQIIDFMAKHQLPAMYQTKEANREPLRLRTTSPVQRFGGGRPPFLPIPRHAVIGGECSRRGPWRRERNWDPTFSTSKQASDVRFARIRGAKINQGKRPFRECCSSMTVGVISRRRIIS